MDSPILHALTISTTFFKTKFPNSFSWMKWELLNLPKYVLWDLMMISQKSSENGLSQKRHQIIIWISGCLLLWSLYHSALMSILGSQWKPLERLTKIPCTEYAAYSNIWNSSRFLTISSANLNDGIRVGIAKFPFVDFSLMEILVCFCTFKILCITFDRCHHGSAAATPFRFNVILNKQSLF